MTNAGVELKAAKPLGISASNKRRVVEGGTEHFVVQLARVGCSVGRGVPLWPDPMAALIKVFDPVLGWMARRYQAAVAQELKNYGLRYEDLFDPMMNLVRRSTENSPRTPLPGAPAAASLLTSIVGARRRCLRSLRPRQRASQDTNEALNRLPPAEVDARNQRLRRAHDISLKKEYLPKEQQALQTPYLKYLEVPPGTSAIRILAAMFCGAQIICSQSQHLRLTEDLQHTTACSHLHKLHGPVQDGIEQVQAENRERLLLGTGKSCVFHPCLSTLAGCILLRSFMTMREHHARAYAQV